MGLLEPLRRARREGAPAGVGGRRHLSAPARAPLRTRFDKASVRDADVAGKRVLVRVDFNVPLEGGRVADASRIEAALPTIELLRERGAAVILVSHLGRPEDRDPDLSMDPVAKRLGETLEAEVQLAPDVVGPEVERLAEALEPGAM